MFSRQARSSLSTLSCRSFCSSPSRLAVFASASEEVFAAEVASADKSKLTLVDFYADWCRPCKMLAPILDKVAKSEEATLDLVTVDTEELDQIAAKYSISSLPTVMAFRNGEPVAKFMGFRDEKFIRKFVADAQASASA